MLVEVLFYIFGTILVAAALGVIVSRNPVYSALSLVLCFVTSAAIWLLIEAEFLAIVLVLVYVGAVMVLFLFVVMMLNIDFAALRAGFIRNAPLGAILGVVLFVELFIGILVRSAGDMALGNAGSASAVPDGLSNTAAIGALLYTRYLFEFEAAGMILLVAMIGAIVLTHRQRTGVRGQNVSHQIMRRPEDATVNVKPEIGKGVTL